MGPGKLGDPRTLAPTDTTPTPDGGVGIPDSGSDGALGFGGRDARRVPGRHARHPRARRPGPSLRRARPGRRPSPGPPPSPGSPSPGGDPRAGSRAERAGGTRRAPVRLHRGGCRPGWPRGPAPKGGTASGPSPPESGFVSGRPPISRAIPDRPGAPRGSGRAPRGRPTPGDVPSRERVGTLRADPARFTAGPPCWPWSTGPARRARRPGRDAVGRRCVGTGPRRGPGAAPGRDVGPPARCPYSLHFGMTPAPPRRGPGPSIAPRATGGMGDRGGTS